MTTNRREFLKICAALGIGLTFESSLFNIAKAFQQVKDGKVHVIWLPGAADSGCSISLIQGTHPDVVDLMTQYDLSIDFHENLMVPDFDAPMQALYDAGFGNAPVDVLVVEGSVSRGNFLTLGEVDDRPVTFEEWLERLGRKAGHVVAVGTCAAYGGIPAGDPNPTGARGVQDFFKEKGIGKTVINIPGCPPHPDWFTLPVAALLLGKNVELDSKGRPTAFFQYLVHDFCPRRGWYDQGVFSSNFGEEGCLWKLGCKGPITSAACPWYKWNSGLNMCTLNGTLCYGCVEPEFPDPPLSPFFKEIESVPAPLGIDVNMAGVVIGAATTAGIAAHALRRFALTRPRESAAEATEEEKQHA
jgi:hydrogenase small subunit